MVTCPKDAAGAMSCFGLRCFILVRSEQSVFALLFQKALVVVRSSGLRCLWGGRGACWLRFGRGINRHASHLQQALYLHNRTIRNKGHRVMVSISKLA